MKKTLFRTIMCVGIASMLLGGCTNDDVYNPEAVVKKYENAWEKQFGKVDPNQTWNTAKQVTANIDLTPLAGDYTLKIYTANPINKGACLLAKKQINGSGSIIFDVPQTLGYVFVEAESKSRKTVNSYYPVSGDAINISNHVQTRAGENCNATIGEPYTLTYKGWNSAEGRNFSFTHTFAQLQNVEKKEGDTWQAKDWLHIVGYEGVFKEGENNLTKWKDRLGTSVEYVTRTEGPVELSLNYGATQNRYSIGYFYYKTGEDLDQATRYVLFNNYNPNNFITIDGSPMTGDGMTLANIGDGWGQVSPDAHITGSKIKLVYNDNGTPSYTFPAGTHIVFFVSKSNKPTADIYNIWNSITYTDGYNPYNVEPNSQIHTCAVTYKYRNQIILGIEDGGDWDMNDLLFFVDGEFADEPEDIDPDPTPDTGLSWILACEDLGSTDDFDFNDIVFSVSHVSGETTATVTPLAAGGTLPAYICFGSQELGEIHTLLGGSSTTEFINTTGSKGTAGEPVTINVDKDFSMASNNMGGFSVKVITKDNSEATVRITAPGQGTAPQMICVPGEWAWPTERTNISDAYPAFGEWGANYATNKDWYKNPNGGVVK